MCKLSGNARLKVVSMPYANQNGGLGERLIEYEGFLDLVNPFHCVTILMFFIVVTPSALLYFRISNLFIFGIFNSQRNPKWTGAAPNGVAHLLFAEKNVAIGLYFAGALVCRLTVLWSVMQSAVFTSDPWLSLLVLIFKIPFAYVALESFCLSSFINITPMIGEARFTLNANNLLPSRRRKIAEWLFLSEINDKRNVAVAVAQALIFLGNGMCVAAVFSTPISSPFSFTEVFIFPFIYSVSSALCVLLFAKIYDMMTTSFYVVDELRKQNVAAGLSYGMNYLAVSIMVGGIHFRTDSLLAVLFWYFFGPFILVSIRVFVDRVILFGSKLDQEICRDQNWGAAIVEGTSLVAISMVCSGVLPVACTRGDI